MKGERKRILGMYPKELSYSAATLFAGAGVLLIVLQLPLMSVIPFVLAACLLGLSLRLRRNEYVLSPDDGQPESSSDA
jgi:hypothetical protein